MSSLNERDYANRLSGAYEFRNTLWDISHDMERMEHRPLSVHYVISEENLISFISAMGYELGYAIDSGNASKESLIKVLAKYFTEGTK